AGVGRSTLSVACCAWRPARTAAGSRRVVHASQRVRADHLPQPIEVARQLEPGDQLSPELRRQVLVGAGARRTPPPLFAHLSATAWGPPGSKPAEKACIPAGSLPWPRIPDRVGATECR